EAERETDERREDDRHADLRESRGVEHTGPAFATPAPASPPMSACDELDGMPNHHVIRSHAIAPASAANTTGVQMILGRLTPLPIVVATACRRSGPRRS